MRIISIYRVAWENAHASGVLPYAVTSKRAAEKIGAEWKRDMVSIDENPSEARQEYQWEVVTTNFYVEREFMWPGHCYYVYEKATCPRTPVVKEVTWKHLMESLCKYAAKPDVREVR